ncbi:Por secretion system C-terminal sorting domain-containing protein [Hymenobacter gelipurpurascens]|uniref:Por secretion system C-terminal sorting domain-containing protein n=1 Tax=Hymenobacter gelipurpurascens TaxID=89968 RepID=A0A212TP87_9BACT|nr:family 16 glycosylhydrolase [Hymenobacter gelipurpurascens]SNC67641.1 Por secretion system C-terminal sorting domain-containing protein [Hymenobacter gelipurpurascens]
MKNRLLSTLGAAALALLGHSTAHAQTYQQVWADEFTTGISSSWVFETGGGGWGNNEKQYYQRANATVANGILQITAKKENVGGMPYTSSRMKTQGLKEFKYGKVEARMKLPLGQGLWPAFWMLGANINTVSWPACGEIDVMEHINAENKVYGTVHWDSNGHAEYGGNIITTPQDYHVYSIEWEPTYIRWFVDGTKYHEINITNGTGGTEEFQRPFFLLLNLAVAGNWPGQTVDESKLPATMYVDYVRVYQKNTTTTPPPTGTSITIQAEAYSSMNGVQTEATTDTGGGQNVAYIDAGDWMAYNNINFPTSGTYNIEYRVASPSGGTLSSDLNAGSIQLGNTTIPATGGWQNWTTVSKTVNVNAGTYNFGVFAQTGGWNLNWIRITKTTTATATATQTASILSTESAAGTRATGLQLYPNPVENGNLRIQADATLAGSQYQIVDGVGRTVSSGRLQTERIDVSGLKTGVYQLTLLTADNQRLTQRFVK